VRTSAKKANRLNNTEVIFTGAPGNAREKEERILLDDRVWYPSGIDADQTRSVAGKE